MNKKAQYTATLVVFLIVVFGVFAYVMYKTNKIYKEEIKINIEGSTTFNIYGLAEKNKYYLEKSAELSKQKANLDLQKNAGYLPGDCNKDLITGKIIWNSCKKLTPENTFKYLFEPYFKEYIKNQYQFYKHNDYDKTLNKDEIKSLNYSLNIANNKINLLFNEFTYNTKYTSQSEKDNSYTIKYTFNPSFSIESIDFSIYYNLCDILSKCNLGNSITQNQINSCISELNNINGINPVFLRGFIAISYENIDILVNPKQEISCI